MLKDQQIIKKYFCTGRHNSVNAFCWFQSLFEIQKHCIRENANTYILFLQGDKKLKYFHEDKISGDMDLKEFKEFFHKAWIKPCGFDVLNLWDDAICGRYWANYTHVYASRLYLDKLKHICYI